MDYGGDEFQDKDRFVLFLLYFCYVLKVCFWRWLILFVGEFFVRISSDLFILTIEMEQVVRYLANKT